MLASLTSVLGWAEERGCAAAAFDTPNLELLLAAIGAAEARDEPVIIQHAQLHESETSIDVIGPIMVMRAEAACVPVCVMLDHGEDLDYVRRRSCTWGCSPQVRGGRRRSRAGRSTRPPA